MPRTSAWVRRSPTDLVVFGERDQPLGRVRPAVEDHVLDQRQQILWDFLVHAELPGVDDTHGHA
jgi:hypothetical protein